MEDGLLNELCLFIVRVWRAIGSRVNSSAIYFFTRLSFECSIFMNKRNLNAYWRSPNGFRALNLTEHMNIPNNCMGLQKYQPYMYMTIPTLAWFRLWSWRVSMLILLFLFCYTQNSNGQPFHSEIENTHTFAMVSASFLLFWPCLWYTSCEAWILIGPSAFFLNLMKEMWIVVFAVYENHNKWHFKVFFGCYFYHICITVCQSKWNTLVWQL